MEEASAARPPSSPRRCSLSVPRRSHWVLIGAAVIFAALLSIFAAELGAEQRKAHRDVEHRFVERTTTSAALIEALFESSSNISRTDNARRYGGAKVSPRRLAAFAREQHLTGLAILEHGKLVAAAPQTPPGVRRAIRVATPAIERTLRKQPLFVSGVVPAGAGTQIIEFAQRVDVGRRHRVLVSTLAPRLVYRLLGGYLARVPNERRGGAFLLDQRGAVIASPMRGVRPGGPVADPALQTALSTGDHGLFGRGGYFAARPVGHTTWRVVLTAPTHELFAAVTGSRKWVPWILFIAFAAVAVLALGLLRRVLRAADELAVANDGLEHANDALEARVWELHQTQERYALAVRGANDGIWDWDLTTGRLYFSERWKAILGHDGGEIGASPAEWITRVHADDVGRVQAAIEAHIAGTTGHFEDQHRIRHRDGTYRWVVSRGIAIRDASGRATRMAGSMSDVTDRKSAEDRLRHDALHDALTGLPNRTLFLDRLTRSLMRGDRNRDYQCAVLFLDLDRFKLVNDSFSHAIGDELLKTIAGRLTTTVRPADTVARLSGDEFTILLDELDNADEAAAVARRALAAIERPLRIGGHELFVTASVGIALSERGVDASTLMRNADIAMYDAKRHGKARWALFTAGMHSRVLSQLHVETELRSALDDGRMRVFYQPIVDLSSGEVVALEALARWPAGVPAVPPDVFVPVAEESGLIRALGRHVLEEACDRLSRWREDGVVGPGVTISVNISRWQLTEPGLLADVTTGLERARLPATALRLEITESTMVTEPDRLRAALEELERLGVRTHIDDFGTGHSSLADLKHFPADTLKIDRSFIATLDDDEGSQAIVGATIALAKTLGLRTTAEGVETDEQRDKLATLGCDFAQGYLFSKPLEAADAEQFLRSPSPSRLRVAAG
jgi:diguanylate cyclase (GGDEF)-like protein/PAS domain S-box-containing protein